MQTKIYTRFSAISLAAMLCACGGASSGASSSGTTLSATGTIGTNSTSTSSALANSGSVTAPFVATGNAKYVLGGIGTQVSGVLSATQQDANGVFTAVGSYAFTGTPTVTNEINGEATYAMGRWRKGTVTNSSGASVLSGADNSAFHYLVYNLAPAFPGSGSLSCDAGKFTAPSFVGGTTASSSDYFGVASGSATLTFSASGAAVSATIKATTSSSSSASASFTGAIATPGASVITGAYFGSGQGAMLNLGDGGSAGYLILTPYRIAFPNGAYYLGAAVFHCK